MASQSNTQRVIYQAGPGRKLALTIFLLALIPFAVSMPIMVAMRGMRGFYGDALLLLVVALVFFGCLAFILVHVVASHRTKIAVDMDKVIMRVPEWRGPTPGLKYVRHEVPFNQIKAIETRGEVFRELGVPVVMRSVSVLTKDGKRVVMGYQQDDASDPAFPFQKIASDICVLGMVPHEDRGLVQVGSQYKALANPNVVEAGEPVTEESFNRLKNRNRKVMFGVAIILMALAGVGLVRDAYATGWAWQLDWLPFPDWLKPGSES